MSRLGAPGPRVILPSIVRSETNVTWSGLITRQPQAQTVGSIGFAEVLHLPIFRQRPNDMSMSKRAKSVCGGVFEILW